MKKVLLCLLLFAFVLPVYAANPLFTYGSGSRSDQSVSARLYALGGVSFILSDSCNDINLFESGFGAGIFGIAKQNTLTLSPGLEYAMALVSPENTSSSTESTTFLGGGNGYTGNGNKSGLLIFPADDFALSVKPHGKYIFGRSHSYTESGMGSDYFTEPREYLYGATVEASKKLSPGFAVSGMLGYTSRVNLERSQGDINFNEYGMLRPDFELSAAFLSQEKGGLNLAVNIGNKGSADPMPYTRGTAMTGEALIMPSAYLEGMYFLTSFNENSVSTTKTVRSSDLMLYHINFGAAREGEADAFSLKLGIHGSPAVYLHESEFYYETSTNKQTGSDIGSPRRMLDFELGASADLAYRINLGPVTTGIKTSIKSLHIKVTNSENENFYWGKAAAGAAFTGIEGLKVPVEAYYDLYSQYDYDNTFLSMQSYGVALGAEISLSKELAIRFGGNLGMAGFMDAQSTSVGTTDNRGLLNYGATTGIGFKNGSINTNIGLKWGNMGQSPLQDNYKTNSLNSVTIVSDIVILL